MADEMPLKAMALVGATGSGKSALAMTIAEQDDTCLISCDSMQVYRGLDIGTAKPTKDEQARVRHALIDCADIHETWSAQIWADAAKEEIKKENAKGKVPIIVGGTGMYLKALIQGFAEVPAENEGVREHFEQLQQLHGTPYLHQMLAQVDEALAARLEIFDTQRIIRGLSVYESSGTPLSVWHQKQGEAEAKARATIDCPIYVLEIPRDQLREKIAIRCHQMMDEGWLEETRWLLSQRIEDKHPAMRAVGYRQLLNHLEGDVSLDQAVVDAITATRRYAKRQNTWFNNQTPDAIRGNHTFLKETLNSVARKIS